MQSDPGTHVTALRLLPLLPWSGEVTKDHDVPSQCSVRVWPPPRTPTDQQSEAESHVTLSKARLPIVSGNAIRDQVVPSQCTLSEPTAQQSVDDVHVMLESQLFDVGNTAGGVTFVQLLPSHFSIKL